MSKFSNKKEKPEKKIAASLSIEKSLVDKILDIHWNFSEWVRDAIIEKLEKDKSINDKVAENEQA